MARARGTKKTARVARLDGPAFDMSGSPLKIAPPPVTALTLFDTWRRLAPTLAGTGHTKALCDARAVVGMPATMREEALIEALTETLRHLYDVEADLAERPSQQDLDTANEDREEAEEALDDMKQEKNKLDEQCLTLTAEVASLERQRDRAEALNKQYAEDRRNQRAAFNKQPADCRCGNFEAATIVKLFGLEVTP